MEKHKGSYETKYIISRVFSENKTTEMLIEERIRNAKTMYLH